MLLLKSASNTISNISGELSRMNPTQSFTLTKPARQQPNTNTFKKRPNQLNIIPSSASLHSIKSHQMQSNIQDHSDSASALSNATTTNNTSNRYNYVTTPHNIQHLPALLSPSNLTCNSMTLNNNNNSINEAEYSGKLFMNILNGRCLSNVCLLLVYFYYYSSI